MKMKSGGQLEKFGLGLRLAQIRISKAEHGRSFELWIESTENENGHTGESLSYLTVDEMLDLKEEIDNALLELLNK